MPKYLISYRKTEETGQKPEWAAFTCESELSLEAHAVKERVEKRMSVLGEKLWGNAECGSARAASTTSSTSARRPPPRPPSSTDRSRDNTSCRSGPTFAGSS
jgi:hypothetical protein